MNLDNNICTSFLYVLEKSIIEDYNGNTSYSFNITNSGVEYLLVNEERIEELIVQEEAQSQGFARQQRQQLNVPQQSFQDFKPDNS